jgi:poly-gamma-glutamate capsule biosynthesis protein CapA/YwtB (metallophosphatase superfamily)
MDSGTLLVLAGDVMTGRGVDQILPHPVSPRLHEEYVLDARSYVDLAERANGPIARPVAAQWPWGEALAAMDGAVPGVRLMNLETSVTRSDELAPGKAVRYRMSPDNIDCLTAARIDVWALANNHVLDHGPLGLLETLETLHTAGQRTAGAGVDETEAWQPAVVGQETARVVVASVAHVSSGVPLGWGAGPAHPGVALLPDLSEGTAESLVERMLQGNARDSAGGDLLVVSVHWGGNWGYHVPREHRRFAHRLVEAGVHVVHGHSSHHPRPMEVHHGRLVLYGCGDLVNDYEGIRGYEGFRDDLRLLYLARVTPGSGDLLDLSMLPFQARQMRLWHADRADAAWLSHTLDEACRRLGTSLALTDEGTITLRAAG